MGKKTFDAKRGNLWKFNPLDLVIIGIDTDDGPEHELYDERINLPIDNSMVLNIKAYGVKSPVTIRNRNGIPEVVDGRRRVIHARIANEELAKVGDPQIVIPATLEVGDEKFMEGILISLNENRVNDDFISKANKAVKFLQRNGNDEKEVAIAFGVTVPTIKNWVKLVELSAKVKKAVSEGKISPSAAIQLHGLPKSEQEQKLSEVADKAKETGKKKPTGKAIQRERGVKTAVGKKILKKFVTEESITSQIDTNIVFGIKLALGEYVPDKGSKLGKLLIECGYEY